MLIEGEERGDPSGSTFNDGTPINPFSELSDCLTQFFQSSSMRFPNVNFIVLFYVQTIENHSNRRILLRQRLWLDQFHEILGTVLKIYCHNNLQWLSIALILKGWTGYQTQLNCAPNVKLYLFKLKFDSRCMELTIVHDLAECIVGDITPVCGISAEEKHRREQAAMEELAELVGASGPYLLQLFEVELIVLNLTQLYFFPKLTSLEVLLLNQRYHHE